MGIPYIHKENLKTGKYFIFFVCTYKHIYKTLDMALVTCYGRIFYIKPYKIFYSIFIRIAKFKIIVIKFNVFSAFSIIVFHPANHFIHWIFISFGFNFYSSSPLFIPYSSRLVAFLSFFYLLSYFIFSFSF